MLLKLLVKLVLSLNATPGWAPMQAGWLDLRPRHELAHCCLPSDGTKPCLRWHPFPILLSQRVVFVMSHDSVHLRQALLHVPQHADGFLVEDTHYQILWQIRWLITNTGVTIWEPFYQVPQLTCFWKWHSWQLGTLTRSHPDVRSQINSVKRHTFVSGVPRLRLPCDGHHLWQRQWKISKMGPQKPDLF